MGHPCLFWLFLGVFKRLKNAQAKKQILTKVSHASDHEKSIVNLEKLTA